VVGLGPHQRLRQARTRGAVGSDDGLQQGHHRPCAGARQEERACPLLDGGIRVPKERDDVLALEPFRGGQGFEQRLLLGLVFEGSGLERLERGLLPPNLVLHPVEHSRVSVHHAYPLGKNRKGQSRGLSHLHFI